jgi:hypothetical protein
VKRGTLKIEVRIDARRAVDQVRGFRLATALLDANLRAGGRSHRGRWKSLGWRSERRRQQLRLAAARRCQADDPRIDIQVVTMADGACRVVVRRLGGWSIPPASSPRAGAAAGFEQQPTAGGPDA